ncbi:PREDICTED: transcription factor bHLH95 [Nelumbo nucifera]|uniref:BHLH domain-containing protein n=2 Tax=Nelumbo nucifera TaxID=4432 RepID=A0A822XQT0_NELNU|nr:PREDICTED: transcription factor bHLH95 [Nelumbo nucifera]DAD21511.1 TPA_asm: hypothetical protein HUJ06_022974 [Nelumbo nucifera]
MSEERGDTNFWENSWAFANSDNSGGSEEKSGNKPPQCSNSQSPTATMTVPMGSQKRGRNGASKNGKGSAGEPDHEIHIWTERERRKKMRNMFSNLHALLPHLPAKADKSTIVDEAVNYIKTLQQSLQKLQKQRLEMIQGATIVDFGSSPNVAPPALTLDSRESFLADHGSASGLAKATTSTHSSLLVPRSPSCFQTWSSPNVVLSVYGDEAQISLCSPRKPGLLPTIFYVLEKHKLEVITAHISSDYYRTMCMIHVQANGTADQFPEVLPMEEIYKLAVGEMIFWLSAS